MALTLLDLYNSCASQEWSMYDSGVQTTEEMDSSLVLALNKALAEILYSYPFKFRERTLVDFTFPNVDSYEMPFGIIMKNDKGDYLIKLNNKNLRMLDNPYEVNSEIGIPDSFYIKGNNLFLHPIPCERFVFTVDYYTLAVGEDKNGEEIFKLSDAQDTVTIPEHLEEILKHAVISRTMLDTISSESDENYSAYKKQSETSYRQLVKYSKGGWQNKAMKI